MRDQTFIACAWLLALVPLTLVGCQPEGPENVPEEPCTLDFPATPDVLMANFKTAYEYLCREAYLDEVLDPDYLFVLQSETVDEFALPDRQLTFDQETAITGRMFSGQPDSRGHIVMGIEIQQLVPLEPWQTVPPEDPVFGTVSGALMRGYQVLIYFYLQGDLRYEVQGQQRFYVATRTTDHEGVQTARYSLIGQADNTATSSRKGTDVEAWGAVKALFRDQTALAAACAGTTPHQLAHRVLE